MRDPLRTPYFDYSILKKENKKRTLPCSPGKYIKFHGHITFKNAKTPLPHVTGEFYIDCAKLSLSQRRAESPAICQIRILRSLVRKHTLRSKTDA